MTSQTTSPPTPAQAAGPDDLAHALVHMGIVGAHQPIRWIALAGGVSSDIYRAELPSGVICVKRALPKLKVAADWRAPVERNRFEVDWMRVAGAIVPSAVPAILGEDRDAGAFAMAWLAPDDHPVWKSLLAAGEIAAGAAAAVGAVLGRIHAATADRPDLALRFATDDIFFAIRLDPYLVATGRAHPDLSSRFDALVETTRTTKRVLVHGDFSPKNLLQGPAGPVVLDAECAWYGDPAFDLAFLLNHLLLKGVWRPQWTGRYLECFDAIADAYRAGIDWEPVAELEARVAHLLPGLTLGRIDGKSPVEYLTTPEEKDEVRRFARRLLADPARALAPIAAAWAAGTPR